MNIFDILGPVMVGPSSSHTAGAVRIGLLARESINIATMNLYRSKRGGDAVMVTEVDQNIPEALVEDLKKVDGILKVTCLNI